jgi:ferredoxin
MSFGWAADYLIRNGMAKEADKKQAIETLAIAKDFGLVLNADNVQKKVTYLCQCCGCCCNVLLGYNRHGYENVVVTSSFIAQIEPSDCTGCGKCAKACPINAIDMQTITINKKKTKQATIDESVCIGCGVCALKCKNRSLELVKRKQRVIHPETTFHRVILQCLERGTLQNQIFDNPESITQGFMRGIIGGFLKLPAVKQALMSDILRSSFLKAMETGIKLQGKKWLISL